MGSCRSARSQTRRRQRTRGDSCCSGRFLDRSPSFWACSRGGSSAPSARRASAEQAEEGRAMTIQLDHTIVPSRDKVAAAKLLGELLGVPWAPSGIGPFAPVYVNDGLTLDFIDT